MHEEYRAIVDAGLLLQIDDPRLVTQYIARPDLSVEECRRWARRARRGAEPRAARHPRGARALPHLLQHQHGPARPRHGAEGHRRRDPEDQGRRLLVRGGQPAPRARVAGLGGREAARGQGADPRRRSRQSTVLVEHPELVAQRIVRFASVVGPRERHRRRRLRLRDVRRLDGDPPDRSPGRSSPRWSRARGWRVGVCGVSSEVSGYRGQVTGVRVLPCNLSPNPLSPRRCGMVKAAPSG